jgi:hypothetical protein
VEFGHDFSLLKELAQAPSKQAEKITGLPEGQVDVLGS